MMKSVSYNHSTNVPLTIIFYVQYRHSLYQPNGISMTVIQENTPECISKKYEAKKKKDTAYSNAKYSF